MGKAYEAARRLGSGKIEDRSVILQALIVHGIALDRELLNNRGRPFAELHGTFRVDLVTNSDNG